MRRADLVFLAPFALYTSASVSLLVLGLGTAAAVVSAPLRDVFTGWSEAGGLLAPLWRAMVVAAGLSEPPPLIALDYVVSAFNLGLGLVLVRYRPHDTVARLLAIGMIGTAAAYNYQVHGLLVVARPQVVPGLVVLNVLHLGLHALSGAAYVHALLLFPSGTIAPARLRWVPWAIYFLLFEELTVLAIAAATTGRVFSPLGSLAGLVLFGPGIIGQSAPEPVLLNQLIEAEILFFVLLIGLALPVVGIASQAYRLRHAETGDERRQAKVVLWALLAGLSAAALYVAITIVALAAQGVVFSADASTALEDSAQRVLPLILNVIPAALVVAIFRYRLFDLSLAVDRTLVYAPITAVLTILFLASVWALQQVLRGVLGGPSEIAVAIAALVNGVLFQPLRRRIVTLIERRLLGQRAGRTRQEPAPASVR